MLASRRYQQGAIYRGSNRLVALALLVVLCVIAAMMVSPVRQSSADPAVGSGGGFVATSGRALDTRSGTGGYTTPMVANAWRPLQISGHEGVPTSGASAVTVSLTTINPAATGVLYAFQGDTTPNKSTSVLNFSPNQTQSNSAIIQLGADGTIQLMANSSTDLLVDVEGYYTSSTSSGSGYSPITPVRVVDTRSGTGLPEQPVAPGSTSRIQIASGAIPAGATAVFVNFGVEASTQQSGTGYLTPYADGGTRPQTSLDFPRNEHWVSISAQVPLSSAGAIDVYLSNSGSVDMIVDVEGYFTSGSANGSFTPYADRLIDTRVSPRQAINPNQTVTVQVGGMAQVPGAGDGLTAAVLNIAVTDIPTPGGYLKVWADGTTKPADSQMTYYDHTVSDLITSATGSDAAIEVENVGSGTVDLVVDLEGYYTGANSSLCPGDQVLIHNIASAGAGDGEPTVSAVLTNTEDAGVTGDIYVQDSNGNEVGSTPTATAEIDSGTALTYSIPPEDLTAGQTYTWWIHAYTGDSCGAQSTSSTQSFVEGTPSGTAPFSSDSTATVTGTALQSTTAPLDTQGCAGQPCAVRPGVSVGSDGTNHWVAGVKVDLSAIPAGASILSANLMLTTRTCLSGQSCSAESLEAGESQSDIATASTGSALAADVLHAPDTSTETSSGASIDVTDMVDDWYTGNMPNDGLVIEAAAGQSAGTGIQFNSESAAGNPLELVIDYAPPTLPTLPQSVSTIAGDGGLIVRWAPPVETGYANNDDGTSGVSTYTVSVTGPSGTSAGSATTSGDYAVLTGLTDGTNYQVSVSATNLIGTGAAASASGTPVSVPGGSALYQSSVQQLTSANDALAEGAALSTDDAADSDSEVGLFRRVLTANAATLEADQAAEADSGEQDTDDVTALNHSLAVPNADGTVTFYTTEDETYDTVDTSTGTTISTPGESIDDVAFTFSAGSTAQVLYQEDADSLLIPLNPSEPDTASAPETLASDNGTVAAQALAVDPVNQSDTSVENLALSQENPDYLPSPGGSAPTNVTVANLAGTAAWAKHEVHKVGDNGYGDDCTDFLSRAIHYGGGLSETNHDTVYTHDHTGSLSYWYYISKAAWKLYPTAKYSDTWGLAVKNFEFFTKTEGAPMVGGARSAAPGEAIYVNWYGNSYQNIDHAAVITGVNGSNLLVTQHTNDHYNEPVYKWPGKPFSWQSIHGKKFTIWIVIPERLK